MLTREQVEKEVNLLVRALTIVYVKEAARKLLSTDAVLRATIEQLQVQSVFLTETIARLEQAQKAEQPQPEPSVDTSYTGQIKTLKTQLAELESAQQQGQMRWSSEKPTQPGWYWYLCDKPDTHVIVYVHPGLYVEQGTFHVSELAGQWSGPIAPPHTDTDDKDEGLMDKAIVDVCCGSRMFWFNRTDPRALFCDNRRERHVLKDRSSAGGSRMLTVDPDHLADFTALPFPNDSFAMVVFDPPHLLSNGASGWQAKKYGKLGGDWREMLRRGFVECFRVLRPHGTLIFKWSEHEIPVSKILALMPERPLVGQRCGKSSKVHWLVFMKPAPQAQEED